MAAYKDLIGQKITKVTSNPGEPKTGQMWYNSTTGTLKGLGILEAWSSGAPTTEDKPNLASGAGTQTAGLNAGGNTPASTITNEYNGTGYTVGGTLNNGGFARNMGGTQTAGFCYGNQVSSPDFPTAECEHYNGTAWTTITNVPQVTSFGGSFGSTTAGVVFSGRINNNDDCNTVTSEYDGSSWTSGGTFPAAMRGIGSATGAPATDGISMGGQVQPGGTKQTTVNKYDGTSWTAETGIPTATSFGAGSGANSDDALFFGGLAPSVTGNTFGYNGTSWTAKPSMATGRNAIGGAGTTTAAVAMGGNSPGSDNLTEEFTSSTNAVTAAAWSAGGNINEARRAFGSCGSNTAGLIFGGRLSPTASPPAGYRGQTEQYDGTSWTEVSDLNNTRSNVGGAGTQTTAVAFGGLNPSLGPRPADNVEEWDGSSWTNVTDVPTGSENYGSCGIQTAALQYGGSAPPGVLTTTLEYDGTNWTSGGAMNTGRNLYSGSGTQTAALGAGGQEPSLSSKTEEYNGSTWSEVNNMIRAAFYSSSTSAPQTDTMSFGSGPSVNYVEKYDGTTWSTAPTLGTSRSDGSGFGTSANGSVMVGGPSGPSTYPSATEEFTGETTTGNIADFTTS